MAKNKTFKTYAKIALFGWGLAVVILGLTAAGFFWNDYRTSNAQIDYWNRAHDQIGKETVVRQINEFPKSP